jgi:hypothetical protein
VTQPASVIKWNKRETRERRIGSSRDSEWMVVVLNVNGGHAWHWSVLEVGYFQADHGTASSENEAMSAAEDAVKKRQESRRVASAGGA